VYRTGNQASGSFFIDDALITHEEEVTQTLCEDFAGYRYGFNGKEKDDEVKGAGNSYDFGARMLDVRLGRWLSIDNSYDKYPDISPYAGIGNNPIIFIDPNGKEFRVPDGNGGFIVYTPGMSTTGLSAESTQYVNYLNNIYYNSTLEIGSAMLNLSNSNMVYNIQIEAYEGINPGGSGTFNGSTRQYDIVVDNFGEQTIQILADELAHAYQFETRDIGFAEVFTGDFDENGDPVYRTELIGYDYQDELTSKQWSVDAALGNKQEMITGSSTESYYNQVIVRGRNERKWIKTFRNANGSYAERFGQLGQGGLNSELKGDNIGTFNKPKFLKQAHEEKIVRSFIYRSNGVSITEDTGDTPKHYGNDNNADPD
jgi:RHS repeat-associated protein